MHGEIEQEVLVVVQTVDTGTATGKLYFFKKI